MSDLLEKSLDDIIGDQPTKPRASRNDRVSKIRGPRRGSNRDSFASRAHAISHSPSMQIPDEIEAKSHGQPLLRIRNLHFQLTSEDLAQLFDQVNTLEFCEVQYDLMDESRSTGVAYVQFSSNQARNNAIAIEKFNGKKAVGRILIVENARGLADRLSLPSRGNRRGRPERSGAGAGSSYRPEDEEKRAPKERKAREPRAKRVKKTVEELDAELSEYLNQS
ncbi:hypothetical protein BABINDRAFT_54454, partial [Babjeviella inositovora NRRL Y-12698]